MALVIRWLAGALVALVLSVAGLEYSVCLAAERGRVHARPRAGFFSYAIEDELPVAEEIDDAEASSTTWVTR